jgi:hypothetical protein
MPAGILEVIALRRNKKPAAGSISAAGFGNRFTPDYTIVPPPVW